MTLHTVNIIVKGKQQLENVCIILIYSHIYLIRLQTQPYENILKNFACVLNICSVVKVV